MKSAFQLLALTLAELGSAQLKLVFHVKNATESIITVTNEWSISSNCLIGWSEKCKNPKSIYGGILKVWF